MENCEITYQSYGLPGSFIVATKCNRVSPVCHKIIEMQHIRNIVAISCFEGCNKFLLVHIVKTDYECYRGARFRMKGIRDIQFSICIWEKIVVGE